jgi:hypothetical protein
MSEYNLKDKIGRNFPNIKLISNFCFPLPMSGIFLVSTRKSFSSNKSTYGHSCKYMPAFSRNPGKNVFNIMFCEPSANLHASKVVSKNLIPYVVPVLPDALMRACFKSNYFIKIIDETQDSLPPTMIAVSGFTNLQEIVTLNSNGSVVWFQ